MTGFFGCCCYYCCCLKSCVLDASVGNGGSDKYRGLVLAVLLLLVLLLCIVMMLVRNGRLILITGIAAGLVLTLFENDDANDNINKS